MMAKTVLGQSSWIVDSSMVVADLRGAMEFDIILPTTEKYVADRHENFER